jgi:hypothetical protein
MYIFYVVIQSLQKLAVHFRQKEPFFGENRNMGPCIADLLNYIGSVKSLKAMPLLSFSVEASVCMIIKT